MAMLEKVIAEEQAPAKAGSRERSLRDEASRIGDDLLVRARRTPDGGITWSGPFGYGTELTPLEVRQLPPHLYNGTAGIALFLAALARLRDRPAYGSASLAAVAPLRRKLHALSADPKRAETIGFSIGGLIGLGSFVYALVTIGELLDEPALIREAHAATVLMTPQRIGRDDRTRVQTGAAGALLALLGLHRRMPEANASGLTPLDLATSCGDHLIDSRVDFDGRPPAWPLSPGKPPLAGFSYGAAGVSFALLRLYAATGEARFREAAETGLAFVRGLYSETHRSWRDVRVEYERRFRPRQGTWKDWWASGVLEDLERIDGGPGDGARDAVPDGQDRYPDFWCHGAPGMALGRLGALDVDDGPTIRDEIEGVVDKAPRWLEMAERSPQPGADDLCCGFMGRADLLVEASRRLGRRGHLEAARDLVERVRQRAEREGRYILSSARGTGQFAPGLFQGIAGVGYTLLRVESPETVPCVLLLE